MKFYGYCRDLEIAIMSDGKQLQGAADNKRVPMKNLKRVFFSLASVSFFIFAASVSGCLSACSECLFHC